MLNSLLRYRQLHVILEEDVEPITRTDSDIRSEGVEPVTTETHIRTEAVEPITRTGIRTESEDDFEDSNYVVVDSNDGDSGFEESEIDMSDEEGFAHNVHVGIHIEMDCTNLNSDMLGGLPAMILDDENVGVDDLHSASESDSDGEFTKNRKPRCPEFHNKSDSLNPQFEKGIIFGDKDTLKQAVRQYEIKNTVDVKFKRICNKKVQAVCKEGCPWYLWASRFDLKDKSNLTWQIKAYVGEHQCMMSSKNRNATYKWLAKTYIEKYRADPTYSSRLLKKDVMADHVYNVSYGKCLRAKHLALEMVLRSHKEQYSMIYDYLGEIRQTNPGSTTILMLDERVFLRMYICLQACKDGYKAGCRSVLSIDGCHLKGYYGGTFVAVVAVDRGVQIRGLVEAISEVFPCAEHRTCVRHLYSNFKNRENFKGKNLKDALWKAARATYVKEFEDAMAELKALSVPAFDWLKGKDPAQWSRSHFSPRSKCDMLLSNLSECFNKMILDARDKPILTLMEMVRTKMMQKITIKKEQTEKWTGILCPKIQEKVESAIQQCTRCWPTHAGGQKYQVSAGPLNQHAVDMEHHTCSCRKWDITGIPCIHVVLVMVLRNERPESYVHACYKTTTHQQIYQHFIQPVRGPKQWLHDITCESVIEPKLRRPPGRPKKQRVKEPDEAQNKSGHNQRTCKRVVGANRPIRPPRVASVKPSLRTPKLQVRRATDNMPTSSSHAVCAISSSAADVYATTSSSSTVCATSSVAAYVSGTTSSPPFVFIPTPGYGMTVRRMPSSQEDNTGNQHLSQSSTVIQTSQKDNSPFTMAKNPRMV
ncbi:hypothetical protein V6N13_063914 [Hibiscus sabdariffa]